MVASRECCAHATLERVSVICVTRGTPLARPPPEHRKRCDAFYSASVAEGSPLYLLSALSMLAGCYTLSHALALQPGQTGKLLVLLAALGAYEALFVGLGLFLIVRRRARARRKDAPSAGGPLPRRRHPSRRGGIRRRFQDRSRHQRGPSDARAGQGDRGRPGARSRDGHVGIGSHAPSVRRSSTSRRAPTCDCRNSICSGRGPCMASGGWPRWPWWCRRCSRGTAAEKADPAAGAFRRALAIALAASLTVHLLAATWVHDVEFHVAYLGPMVLALGVARILLDVVVAGAALEAGPSGRRRTLVDRRRRGPDAQRTLGDSGVATAPGAPCGRLRLSGGLPPPSWARLRMGSRPVPARRGVRTHCRRDGLPRGMAVARGHERATQGLSTHGRGLGRGGRRHGLRPARLGAAASLVSGQGQRPSRAAVARENAPLDLQADCAPGWRAVTTARVFGGLGRNRTADTRIFR